MSKEKFTYPKQKQVKGRVIYGTITAPDKFEYKGTSEEEEKIREEQNRSRFDRMVFIRTRKPRIWKDTLPLCGEV